MVECDLAKVDVEGSNPFRRSTFITGKILRRRVTDEDHGFFEPQSGHFQP